MQKIGYGLEGTYLRVIHLKLSNNFDGDLSKLSGVVLCTVHIAEGAVAHLLQQRVPIKAGISRQLAFALAFLSYYAFDDGRVIVGLAIFGSSSMGSLLLLVVTSSSSGHISSLCRHIAVIDCCRREVALELGSSLEWLVVVDVGVTYAILVLIESLLMGVHILNVGCRFGVWW